MWTKPGPCRRRWSFPPGSEGPQTAVEKTKHHLWQIQINSQIPGHKHADVQLLCNSFFTEKKNNDSLFSSSLNRRSFDLDTSMPVWRSLKNQQEHARTQIQTLICTLKWNSPPPGKLRPQRQDGCPLTTLIKVTAGRSLGHLAAKFEQPGGGGGNRRGLKLGWERDAYLLGASGGFFREVVVGVVGLRDATEQHGHDACRSQRGQDQHCVSKYCPRFVQCSCYRQ